MFILFAAMAILGWGTWLGVGQSVRFAHPVVRTVWVGAFNIVLSFFVAWGTGAGVTPDPRWVLAFLGGLIWALSGVMAFTGANHIGITKANGIWAPLNLITGLVCSMIFLGEFRQAPWEKLLFLVGCVAVLLVGILVIIFAKAEAQPHDRGKKPGIGFLGAIAAGFLWGLYFIPVNASGLTTIQAQLPLSIGIFVGALLMCPLFKRPTLLLEKPKDYVITGISALIWGVGNYGMLLLTTVVGSGIGFSLSQACLVVNALWGILILRDPPIKSRAAVQSLVGVVVVMAGAILLSTLRN